MHNLMATITIGIADDFNVAADAARDILQSSATLETTPAGHTSEHDGSVYTLWRVESPMRSVVIAQEACADCTEDYGPCERHGETLVMRVGAASRTADELSATFVLDVAGLEGSTLVLSDEDAAFVNSVDGWLEEDDSDRLADLRERAEGSLPEGCVDYWDEGFRIVRASADCDLWS